VLQGTVWWFHEVWLDLRAEISSRRLEPQEGVALLIFRESSEDQSTNNDGHE
jgi:hypothetical protein